MATSILRRVSFPSMGVGNASENVLVSTFYASDMDGYYTEDFRYSEIEIYKINVAMTSSYVDSVTFSFNAPFAFIPYITLSTTWGMDNIIPVVKSITTTGVTIALVNADQNQDYIGSGQDVRCVVIGVRGI